MSNLDDAASLNPAVLFWPAPATFCLLLLFFFCHGFSRYTLCDGFGCTSGTGVAALRMHLSVEERHGCQRLPTIEWRGQAWRRQAARAYWWISGWIVLRVRASLMCSSLCVHFFGCFTETIVTRKGLQNIGVDFFFPCINEYIYFKCLFYTSVSTNKRRRE